MLQRKISRKKSPSDYIYVYALCNAYDNVNPKFHECGDISHQLLAKNDANVLIRPLNITP